MKFASFHAAPKPDKRDKISATVRQRANFMANLIRYFSAVMNTQVNCIIKHAYIIKLVEVRCSKFPRENRDEIIGYF